MKNIRVGDSKSIYPIIVQDDEYVIPTQTDPAETVKKNFNTLLLYIIKMLMKNTKNPYDGFKVDNYFLLNDRLGNSVLSKVPALHKPGRSIKTDNFDDIENLIKAQLAIQEGDQTRFDILNPNIHKGWSRDGDDTVLQTLIDNLINTTPSRKGGAKQKLNGGSQTQPIFQKIRDAQISDIEPFKTYALSINKYHDYERMEKEITDTISKFESEYEKTSNYNKKVGIMVELSNSLFQQKIQTFKIFSQGALKIIKELRRKTEKFDIEKQTYDKKLTDMNKQLLDKTNNYSNVSELNKKLKDYLRYKESSDRNERVSAAHQVLNALQTKYVVSGNIRDKVIFLLNSTEIYKELTELLEISNSIPDKDFGTLKKSLERAKQNILSLETREKATTNHANFMETSNRELLRDLDKQRIFTHKLGKDFESKSRDLENERAKSSRLEYILRTVEKQNVRNLDELRKRHARQIDQLHSKRERTLAEVESLQLANEEQRHRQSEIEQEYEKDLISLQVQHENELRRLQEQQNSALKETAQQNRELERRHEEEIRRLTTNADASAQRRIDAKVEEANEKIRNLEDTHKTEIRALEEKANDASAAASAAAAAEATKDGREALEREVQRLNAEKEKEIKVLEEKYKAEHDALSKNLEQMKKTHKIEIEELQAEKQKNLEHLNAAVSEKSNLESTAQDFNKLKAAFDKRQEYITNLLQSQEEILRESSDNRENYDQALRTVEDMRTMIEELKNENAEKTLQIDSISVEYLNKTGAKLLELENDFKGMIAKLEKDLKDCKDEIARLKKEVLETKELIQSLQAERDECLEKLNTIKLENKRLKLKMDEMTETETSSTNEASSLREQIETLVASQRKLKQEKEEAERTSSQRVTECIDSKISDLQEEYEGLKAKASQDTETFSQTLNEHIEKSTATIKEKEEALEVLKQNKTQMESALNAEVSNCQKRLKKSEDTLNSLTNELKERNEIIQKRDSDISILSESNKSLSKSMMENDIALGEMREEVQKAVQAKQKAEREIDRVRKEARQEQESLAASDSVSTDDVDKLNAEMDAIMKGEEKLAPEAAAEAAAASDASSHAHSRLRMAAAASEARNQRTIEVLQSEVNKLQMEAEKTKKPSENEKRVYNDYIKYLKEKEVVRVRPYDDLDDQSTKLEEIKRYIVSEMPIYFLEKNIKIINAKTYDIDKLQQAVALDIVLYILKSIAGKSIMTKLNQGGVEYSRDALRFVLSIPEEFIPQGEIPQSTREEVAKYFYHMISSDMPLASIRSSVVTKPSATNRYVKKLHRNFDETLKIGSGHVWTNIKEHVLYSHHQSLGPNDNIVITVQQIISSIIPHIRGMLKYFEDRLFGSLKHKEDSFLKINSDFDKPREDELRGFLTGLQNNNPNEMIEGFSKYLLQEEGRIIELHSIIASKAVPIESRFRPGGSSSKLVYSLKKRKSNKGNKTKRHKGNKSK